MNLKKSKLNLLLFYSILLINFISYSLHRSETEITQEINQRELELKNLRDDLEKFKKTQPDLNLDALKSDIANLEHLLTTLRYERETTPALVIETRRELEAKSIDQLSQEIKKQESDLKKLRQTLQDLRKKSKASESTSMEETAFAGAITGTLQKIAEIEINIRQLKDVIRQKESPTKNLLSLGEQFVKELASTATSSKRLEELPKMSEKIGREIRHLIAAKDITKIDLNTRLSNGSTLLMIASELAENVAAQIIPLLLANGANINAINPTENARDATALTFAVYHKNPETVRLLLSNGADVNVGRPLISLAIDRATKDDKRDVLIIKRLINAGARVTQEDIDKAKTKGLEEISRALRIYPKG